MKNSSILYPIFLSIALLIGIVIGVVLDFPGNSLAMNDYDQREQKLRQIMNYIDYEYVDELNTDSILDATIASLLRQLDPHSSYIPQEEVAASNENMRGSFSGIGIEFKIIKDTLTVMRVIEDGPAEQAGLQQGDRILAADSKQLFGYQISTDDIIAALKGKSGSKVRLSIFQPAQNKMALVTVKRGEVPINSVLGSFMLNEDIGYVKLLRFAERSAEELERAIKSLKREGATKLVLDLRDNPGGLLMVARQVSDQFLDKGELVVFTKDREGRTDELYATARGVFEEGELVVLINEGSASASEIVAGALQDNDRAWIVGRRSFGKGLVQEEMTLGDGSKIRLTTSRYYTPSGRSIQKPFEDYHGGASPMEGGDPQLQEEISDQAFRTKSGRVVYGGGGITPDVEVPLDTSRAAAIIYHLSMLANFNERSFSFVDQYRERWEGWSESRFMQQFVVDEEVMAYFFGNSLRRITSQSEPTQDLIKARMKAYIAYNIYGKASFQRAYADFDPALVEAQRLLRAEKGLSKR